MTDWSDHDDDDDDPWWQLVGVLLPPFLHGLCLCADVPRVAEGILPSLASALASLIAQARNVLVTSKIMSALALLHVQHAISLRYVAMSFFATLA